MRYFYSSLLFTLLSFLSYNNVLLAQQAVNGDSVLVPIHQQWALNMEVRLQKEAVYYEKQSVKQEGQRLQKQAAYFEQQRQKQEAVLQAKREAETRNLLDFKTQYDSLLIAEIKRSGLDSITYMQKRKAYERQLTTDCWTIPKKKEILYFTSCEAIHAHFQEKIVLEEPYDLNLLHQYRYYILRSYCSEDSIYVELMKKYPFRPSIKHAEKAMKKYYLSHQYGEALNSLQQCIDLTTNPLKQDYYYLQMAIVTVSAPVLTDSVALQALHFAQKAIELNPLIERKALVFIGDLYASSASICGNTAWDQQVLLWAAFDCWEKASNILDRRGVYFKRAKQRLLQYQDYLPTKEEGKARGLEEGDIYEVDCWVDVKTKCRFR